MNSKLQQLGDAGQSIWLDNIRRSMFNSGELRALIDLGLRGMTSNPTIFAQAIGSGTDYDAQLASLAPRQSNPERLFEALAIRDIRAACEAFWPVYEESDGVDGLVSLEVSPLLANDTQGSIAAAHRLWAQVNRPNVMIKLPGTPEGLPAITECIASGINVNVTLLFSVEQYEATVNAYLTGLERRVARHQPVHQIASVASLFVSRIDNEVDKLLLDKITQGEPKMKELMGKIGIAIVQLTYERWKALFSSERFAALERAGAHVQRPLWASTSTKNPLYPELMYVEGLVGQQTVNTLPPMTLAALMDHGRITPNTLQTDLAKTHARLGALVKAQVSRRDIGRQLQVDGIKKFAESYRTLMQTINDKRQRLLGGTHSHESHASR